MITPETGVLGVFGDPIGHTLSPAIQNAAIKEAGLDMVYLPFHVTPDSLQKAVEAIRALGLAGVNVTIPHKEKILPLLDEISEEAARIGAVNTVVNREGRLTGHNTDGRGYVRSLSEEAGFDLKGKRIALLGAGGAARGILSSILEAGALEVTVVNRTVERAATLAGEFSEFFPASSVKAVALEKAALAPVIENTDLLINSTSVGMGGKVPFNPLVLSLDRLPKGALVSDIVYRPLDTALLKSARRSGHAVHKGLGMLIYQGAIGFELWTGKEARTEAMWKAALKELDIS